MTPALLHVPQLAALLGLSEKAVRAHVHRRSPAIPAPVRIGRRLAWRVVDVEKWLAGLKPQATTRR